jgi:hypothetical protein
MGLAVQRGLRKRLVVFQMFIIFIHLNIRKKYENGRVNGLVTSAQKLHSKASYRRKDKGRDGSDNRTRKKT